MANVDIGALVRSALAGGGGEGTSIPEPSSVKIEVKAQPTGGGAADRTGSVNTSFMSRDAAHSVPPMAGNMFGPAMMPAGILAPRFGPGGTAMPGAGAPMRGGRGFQGGREGEFLGGGMGMGMGDMIRRLVLARLMGQG